MQCKQLTTENLKVLPSHLETVIFGMGCFWGVERLFWQQEGVWGTAVGYADGHTEAPSYQQICTGQTGYAEVALVAYDPAVVRFDSLLKLFWENHDPTQGMRQGNDVGSQYRSVILCASQQQYQEACQSKQDYQSSLSLQGYGVITTEIKLASDFYFAEDYHQRYLEKNPHGYCGLRGTGVVCAS